MRAVAAHGSLSGAARALGYSQPAISRQVAVAEKAAGQPLFVRGVRGVRTTRAGKLIARFATETLAGLDRLDERLDEITHGPEVRVRVRAFPSANAALLPFALARALEQQPRLTFALTAASDSSPPVSESASSRTSWPRSSQKKSLWYAWTTRTGSDGSLSRSPGMTETKPTKSLSGPYGTPPMMKDETSSEPRAPAVFRFVRFVSRLDLSRPVS